MDKHERFSSQLLSYKVYDNAVVIPTHHPYGGVIDKDGNFISQSGITEEWCSCSLSNYKNIKYIDEEVLYIGWIYPIFGHIITDGIKKAWFLLNNTINCLNNTTYRGGGGKIMLYSPMEW